MIHLPRACRGRTVVLFPANNSHMSCVELALDRLLCTHLGSKVWPSLLSKSLSSPADTSNSIFLTFFFLNSGPSFTEFERIRFSLFCKPKRNRVFFSLHPEIRNLACAFWRLVCQSFIFSVTRKVGMRQVDLFSTSNLFVLSVTPFLFA